MRCTYRVGQIVLTEGIVKDPWAWREEISWGYDDEGNEACFAEEEETEELDD